MKWCFYYSGENPTDINPATLDNEGLRKFQRKYEEQIFNSMRAGAPFEIIRREATPECEPTFDGAIVFSLEIKRRAIMEAYAKVGKPVIYIDKGYFNRGRGVDNMRYFKVCVNATQPLQHFRMDRPHNRLEQMTDCFIFYRPTDPQFIIIAGASERYHKWHNLSHPDEWAATVLKQIRKHTRRPVIYRPKPKIKNVHPIEGAKFDNKVSLSLKLPNCHALVTHGSGAAVDAIIGGVPVFALGRHPANVLGNTQLLHIEAPRHSSDEERRNWLAGMAYHQWCPEEMATGAFWAHITECLETV